MTETGYVHGYATREWERLTDQANALSELLHRDTAYPAGSLILECGCGTGAQTVFLASGGPEARFVSIDVSAASLEQARQPIEAAGHRNVEFQQASIFELPFEDAHFDHVFLCFVLDHLAEPAGALKAVQRVLRREGTVTVIEGDHGSWFCQPQTAEASRVVRCLIDAQARLRAIR
jgi:ubiquinone/menaquinone biosynthesis C-methylase UbiE